MTLDLAATIEAMKERGMDDASIVAALACVRVSETPVLIRDESAERRREKDRIRKARLRNSAEVGGTVTPSPDKEIPPTPPKEITPNPKPPSPPKGGSSPAEFDEFWTLFPNKVGKADALRKYEIARRRSDFGTIMAGLRLYVSKTDDRPWCNPATWLHQERWSDQPAAPLARGSPARRNPLVDAFGEMAAMQDRTNDQPPQQVSGVVLHLPAATGR